MKITMQYPVLAKFSSGGGWRYGMKTGEYEIRTATDEEMPVEIDYRNGTDDHTVEYRFGRHDECLYGREIDLDRMAKIERKNFSLYYSRVHPAWPLLEQASREISALTRKGKNVEADRVNGCVQNTLIDPAVLSRLDDAHVRKWDQAARQIADGLVMIDGSLWRKTDEPYLFVSKGRPRWSIFPYHPKKNYPLGDDCFAFSITEYEKADALVREKEANGGRDETSLRIEGRYSYSNNGLTYSVIALSKGVCNYFANLVGGDFGGGSAYRLEKLPLSILQAYVDLRRIVETPFEEIGEDEAGRAVELLATFEEEIGRIKIKPPFTPRMVRQVIERWEDREIGVELNMPASGPGF
ncbi:hypothetical protein GOB57_21760 [Sinorhizobium meliloti]|nr:hypothetical protein [Sinorhizobium meliloti]